MSSPNSQVVLTGSCQCGRVKYTSTSLPSSFTNCHCYTCRKISCGPYIQFGAFPLSAITWTSTSSLKTTSYSDLAERTHCTECGTPMSMKYVFQKNRISITAGSIDEESVVGVLPEVEEAIFVEDKSKGVDKGLPKYGGFPPEFQKKIDAWLKDGSTF